MADAFESPRFLLTQSSENISKFEGLCEAFLTKNGYTNVVDIEPETGNKVFKVAFRNPLPAKARHLATTALNDIRHALDQAACAAVAVVTGAEPGDVFFPKGETPSDLLGRLRRKIPTELHPIFQSFETYPTQNGAPGGNHTLCALIEAAGPNKHSVTYKVGGRITQYRDDNIRGTNVISIGLPPEWDWDKNEMIIGVTAPNGHLDYQFKIAGLVAFGPSRGLTGVPVTGFLRQAFTEVSRVVDALEAEATRIISSRP
ncbi:hypothetical protein [Phreatobacter sp.]|uniref:hypothetical protein n=1 Tax=Phreatobacter sp. TaxID=1966341 RepID=UPI003F709CA3